MIELILANINIFFQTLFQKFSAPRMHSQHLAIQSQAYKQFSQQFPASAKASQPLQTIPTYFGIIVQHNYRIFSQIQEENIELKQWLKNVHNELQHIKMTLHKSELFFFLSLSKLLKQSFQHSSQWKHLENYFIKK